HTILSSALLILSTFLVGMTFISEEFVQKSIGLNPFAVKWIIGIASILTFLGVLLLTEWGFQGKAVEHREAVRFYFRIVNKIRQWLDNAVEITPEIVEQIRSEYAQTQTIPKIPDARFLKLKQWHLRKVAMSREMDKNPFLPIREISKRIQNSKDSSE
ncbi:MAG TPA: hypothetical protein VJ044_20125, partial [Candidatus Hodarchaeales archaeon]|nr:hypothetical protein [Candidatus Hodarchaeales archaeon]